MQITQISTSHQITEIDEVFTYFKKSNSTISDDHADKVIKNLILNIVDLKGISKNTRNKKNPLFEDGISIYNKQFIAVCLLRLWSVKEDFFERESEFQRKTIKLIEEVISNDPQKFKELNFKANDQTFTKVNVLKHFTTQYEERLFNQLKYDVNSIGTLDTIRPKYLRTIRNNSFEIFIAPFLPKDIQNKIDVTFAKLKTYVDAGPETKSVAFNDASTELDNFLNYCNSFNTFYCDSIIRKLFNEILILIKEDFSNSSFSKPAKLELSPINKKYPFAQVNARFKVGFELHNVGDGYAYNVELKVNDFTLDAIFDKAQVIGTLGLSSRIVELHCEVKSPSPDAIITLNIKWTNFNKVETSVNFEFLLSGQRSDVNWDELEKDFYSTEAVDNQDELIGRREILNTLISRIEGKKVGSAYIHGQRRVGKSSIVKTLKTELEARFTTDMFVFYTETGDYKDPNSNRTIDQLAINICKKIKAFDSRLSHIPFPEFRGALSPITGYLSEVSEILPNCRIVIILDEFDKIPSELYRKGDIGDSFFDTIRAISNKGPYGFLLVGGERMEFIIRDQSQELNKFKSIRVDYFDKSTNWQDFKDLVIKPIESIFEITDEAINFIYDLTSGNPFFTKVVCEEIVKLMIVNRDNYITKENVFIGSERALNETSEQTFAHFWKDGIRDALVNEEEVASNRRKILISYIFVAKKGTPSTFENIIDEAVKGGLQEITAISTLNEFIDRDILKRTTDGLEIKVKFFENWLLKYGHEKLRTTLVESDRIEHERLANEKSRIKSEELVTLTEAWGTYRGSQVTTDKVRSWLEQFGEPRNQRLMFKVLTQLRFYSDYEVKVRLKEIFHLIRKEITEAGNAKILKGKESTRKDIVISYLEDSPAKSGAEYAKLFADENKIFHKNVMSFDKLEKFILHNPAIHSVIFIDDFIGSGNSAFDNFFNIYEHFPALFNNNGLRIYFGAICGFVDAKQKLINKLKRHEINISMHMSELLDESNKIFNDLSQVFTLPADKHLARTLCYDLGSKLVKSNALGYGDCQAIIVFPRTIPNNCLPVLWASSNSWRPLFERPM